MDNSAMIMSNDESFQLLFPPPDFMHTGELIKVDYYVGKLADIREIYKNRATEMADQLDETKQKYADEKQIAAANSEQELKKMQEEIHKCAESFRDLLDKNNTEKKMKAELLTLLKSIGERKAKLVYILFVASHKFINNILCFFYRDFQVHWLQESERWRMRWWGRSLWMRDDW